MLQFLILVASAAAAPTVARRLSEFSALYADSCTSALEQMEAIQPASNPTFDAGCKMSAESFEPSTYATLLPECSGALIAVIVVPLLCCCGIVALVVFCVVRQQAPKKRAPAVTVAAAGGAGKETTQMAVLANSKI